MQILDFTGGRGVHFSLGQISRVGEHFSRGAGGERFPQGQISRGGGRISGDTFPGCGGADFRGKGGRTFADTKNDSDIFILT